MPKRRQYPERQRSNEELRATVLNLQNDARQAGEIVASLEQRLASATGEGAQALVEWDLRRARGGFESAEGRLARFVAEHGTYDELMARHVAETQTTQEN